MFFFSHESDIMIAAAFLSTSFDDSCLHFNVSPTNESGKDDIEVVSSDDNDDVNVANAEVEAEVDEITIWEALTLLDDLVNLLRLNKDDRASLSSIKDILEIIREKSKKQRIIKDFFK